MKYIFLILGISFYLEGIVSNFISISTNYLNPLLSLITSVVIYPFFKNKKRYYQICFGYGILYDFIYTNTLVFHGFLFLFMGYLAHYMYKLLSFNIPNTILLSFIVIVIYRITGYFLLCLIGNYYFEWRILLHSITSSLILNILYMIILFLFLKPRYQLIKI